MRYYFLDHYDSFSANLLDWLERVDPNLGVALIRCDDVEGLAEIEKNPLPLLVSPGPRAPLDYPASLALIKNLLGRVPILGICLGHQMLGELFGLTLVRDDQAVHGSTIEFDFDPRHSLFKRLSCSAKFARYNSLLLHETEKTKSRVSVLGRAKHDGSIQACEFKTGGIAAWGLQFHPESFLSDDGFIIAQNFHQLCVNVYFSQLALKD